MRLHALTVEAFGPFAGEERVDFDALAAGGLFLFTGPTGAGKTSVLDAVCFALYGQVPGSRQQGRSQRSDHAPAGRGPVVVLETTLRGRRLRVTRSPAWERPKQRGTGTTAQPARVLVQERVGGHWETLTTRLDEAGQLLGRLLGLTMAQFCQVVLLPQNQFAEFLRADADRRRDLLESLFDTGRFAAVESWLVERRRVTARRVAAVDERVAAVLARAAEAAGQADPDGVPRPDDPDGSGDRWADRARAWTAALLSGARADLTAAEAEVPGAAAGRDRARRALTEAEQRTAARDRHAVLTARLADLDAGAGEHATVVAELSAGRRAAPLLPLLDHVGRLEDDLAMTSARVERLSGALSGELPTVLAATGTGGAGGVDPAPVRGRAAQMRTEVGRLQQLVGAEAEADEAAATLSALEATLVDLDRRHREVQQWLAAAPAARRDLDAAVTTARAAVAALPGQREELRVAEQRLGAARSRDELLAAAAGLRDRLAATTALAQELRERWLDLRERRLHGVAAGLAAALTDGTPCPVCGSAVHPAPAESADAAVSRDEESAALARSEEAAAERDGLRDEVAGSDRELAALRALAGDVTVGGIEAAAEDLRVAVSATAASAGGLTTATAALEAHDAEAERRLQEKMRLGVDAQDARTRLAATGERLARLRSSLSAARGDDPTVAARAQRLTGLADQCEELDRHLCEGERLRREADRARQEALAEAERLGLPDLEAVAAAGRDDETLRGLEERRERYESELRSVRQQLLEPALTAAAAGDPPDLDGLRAVLTGAEAGHAGRLAETERARTRVAALDRLAGQLAGLLAEREPLAREQAVAEGLSRLAEGRGGDNRLRMSLSAYVLAARLESVAAAANDRLLRMTSGRYTLAHSAETQGGRGRGGLHLRVLDAWTGSWRDPASLSGGESFTASLALALGLADVVTAEAGGGVLESLFVDEGFGSLDEDTLDEVMDVLDGLRDGGRAVGLVSHVSELRQRIPLQLRVEKERTGSRIVAP
jgi:exonuclease SbcC